ncbi:MAG: carbamoyltransferase C-terminal domain-containing protein [Candidatus Krumholzibacteriia bacterium]
MNILGIHDGKDAGVALVVDGKVLFAANEERYSRQKTHFGFPFLALQKLFQHTGLEASDVDRVTVGVEAMVEKSGAAYCYEAEPRLHQKVYSTLSHRPGGVTDSRIATHGAPRLLSLMTQSKEELNQNLRTAGIRAPVCYLNHHLAHAASAYYTSGRQVALVITSDAGRDAISGGIYVARDGKIDNKKTFSKTNSAGMFWQIITQLCGFDPERHGSKITSLAAYSDGEEAYRILGQIYRYHERTGGLENVHRLAYRETFEYMREKAGHLDIEELSSGAQRILEEAFLETARRACERYGLSHVVLAGGTFANVRLNQKILALPGVESAYVHPHMGDGGMAVGSALLQAARGGDAHPHELRDVYWGDDWNDGAIRAELERTHGIRWRRLDDPADAIADHMARHMVVGLFHGRMEYGPRALGHRSILAEPDDPTMIHWLNKRLSRSEFMPFAPVILEEEAPKYFEDFDAAAYAARFMTICVDCQALCKEKAPGIVHRDGTARPQAVSAHGDAYTHRVLRAYQEKTGLPLAINTSLCRHEEPIVGTPFDAIHELKRNVIDVLYLDHYEVKLRTSLRAGHELPDGPRRQPEARA